MRGPMSRVRVARSQSAQEMVSDSRQLFNLMEKDIMRSSAWKLEPGKFRLETRWKFFNCTDN